MSVEITDHRGVPLLAWTPTPDAPGDQRNFGDEIGGIVIDALLDRAGVRRSREQKARRLLSVGSILQFSRERDVVWGSGINGKVRARPLPSSLDVRAVRGPLTRTTLLSHGIPTPVVFGDPALLLPRLRPDLVGESQRSGLVVVPNLNERDLYEGASVISPVGIAADLIQRIASAEFVVASSLHALIIADAFGVPSRPLAPVRESAFKYVDHYAGTGRADVRFARTVDEAIAMGPVSPVDIDLDVLEGSFPMDLWQESETGHQEGLVTYLDLARQASRQRKEVVDSAGWEVALETAAALLKLDQVCAMGVPTDGIAREEADVLGISLPHMRTRATRPDLTLSVVIPTHNVAPWISEALESIRRQEVEGFEIIVVDDHSSDSTPDVVASIAEADDRVRLIRSVSRGGGVARNIGLDHARGKYLVFADGDDIVPDGSYAALIASLNESGSDVAFGDYLKFSPTDTWRPTQNMSSYARPARNRTILDEPELIYSRPCWNKMFSRGFWESHAIRFPNVPRSNDIVPMVKAYVSARRVDIIADVVYLYRERPGMTSMTARADRAISLVSYLSQELECARMVASVHDHRLSRAFSSLVYERDGYVHIRKFLERWEPSEEDDAVVSGLRRLLAETSAPPPWSSPLREIVLRLAAAGDLGAARAMASFAEANVTAADRLAQWQRVLSAPSLREMRDAHRASILGLVEDELVGDDIQTPEEWLALATLVLDFGYSAGLAAVPELSASPTRRLLSAAQDERARLAPRLVRVTGGAHLVLHGTVEDNTDLQPVLFAPSFRAGAFVVAESVEWTRRRDGVREWKASFRSSAIEVGVPFRPALADIACRFALGVPGRPELPEYTAFDSFLYEIRGGVRITRRRHWVPRSLRRAVRIVQERRGAG